MPFTPTADISNATVFSGTPINTRINNSETYLALYDDDIESIRSGWIPVTIAGVAETWTFNSVSGILGVINVASDATTRFQKGDKIKFTQSSTVKQGVIVDIPNSTSIAYFGDTLTNNPISNIFISRADRPFGFNKHLREVVKVRTSRQTTQSIDNSSNWKVVVFNDDSNSINYDLSNLYNTSTGYFTFPFTGYYSISYAVYYTSGTATDCYVRINNSGTLEREHVFSFALSSTYFQLAGNQIVKGIANTNLSIEVLNAGQTRVISSGNFNTFLIIDFVSF